MAGQMISFEELYTNSIELIRANARLINGRRNTYDIITAHHKNKCTAYLIAYAYDTISGGRVMIATEDDMGHNLNHPYDYGRHAESALKQLTQILRKKVDDMMAGVEVGRGIHAQGGVMEKEK